MKLNDILRPEMVAERFGVNVETVLGWRDLGMPWIRLGKMVLISESSLLRWFKTLEKTLTPEKAQNAQDAPGPDFFGKPLAEHRPSDV